MRNKEKQKAYMQEYYKKNKSILNQKRKTYYENNKDKYHELYLKRKPYFQDYQKKWWSENKDRRLQIRYNNNKERKLEIYILLGNKCNICGFDDERALQIDHINGGGAKERKEVGVGNYHLWLYKKMLKDKNSFQKEYQILCANCNWIKRYTNKEIKIKPV